jgi:hypothetical protein
METGIPEDYNKGVPLPFQTARELFHGIPDVESRKITGLLTEKSFAPEAALFYEGGPGDSLFIVRKGLVKLVSLSARGTETILHILRPDDVFLPVSFPGKTSWRPSPPARPLPRTTRSCSPAG